MFNGLIKNTGIIKEIKKRSKSMNITILSNIKIKKNLIGTSISCNGVCLTLTSKTNKFLKFYLSQETIKRSNFSNIKVGDLINMEQSLKYGDEISGHYTQGHVDTIGKILDIKVIDNTWVIKISIPSKYNKYIVEKASIHINGVSLTISKITSDGFQIWAIPHTLRLTNLKDLKKNDIVNIEIDILSKYIKKFINEKK